jgi:galacturonosyltransferase
MKKVLILVNRDFVLYNFRLELVERLIKDGYEVFISLPYGERVDEMVRMGCHFYPIVIDKRGKNPLKDLNLIQQYKTEFRNIHPDIILTYTTKVNIYAGIYAGKMHIPYLMNISGLGTAVEYENPLQNLMIALYRRAAKRTSCLFFQNEENEAFFERHHMYCGKKRLVPGSGVNLDRWYLMDYPSDENGVEFLFIGRVIREKGIEDYLAVAKEIRQEFPNSVFHVLGPCDGDYEEQLAEYQKQGIIQYHGMVPDTRVYLKHAHCTILPSYYPEGISNALLESAACGRPLITTNRSGCRETVEDGKTGFIFEPQDREQLLDCVRRFMALDNETRKQMGIAGRQKMEREFNRKIVIDAYMDEIEEVEYALEQSRMEQPQMAQPRIGQPQVAQARAAKKHKGLVANGLQENN